MEEIVFMLKIKEGFIMRNIVDEWIIVPIGQQEGMQTYIMTVNETGHILWEMLENGTTKKDLLQRILDEYEIDEETATADIELFLKSLEEHDVI